MGLQCHAVAIKSCHRPAIRTDGRVCHHCAGQCIDDVDAGVHTQRPIMYVPMDVGLDLRAFYQLRPESVGVLDTAGEMRGVAADTRVVMCHDNDRLVGFSINFLQQPGDLFLAETARRRGCVLERIEKQQSRMRQVNESVVPMILELRNAPFTGEGTQELVAIVVIADVARILPSLVYNKEEFQELFSHRSVRLIGEPRKLLLD